MAKTKYNCLIIDDEPHIVEYITTFINKTDYLVVKDATIYPEHAMQLLAQEKYDIVFCDIKMPDISGLEIVEAHKGKAAFIMSTAYVEYAFQGFELGVVDYLLKPFNYARFLTAIQKAIALINVSSTSTNKKQTDAIYIKSGSKGVLEKIVFDELEYIEGRKNYIAFVTKDKERLSLMNLKDIEQQLNSDKFMRVHLSYIVATDKISKIEGNSIYLKDLKAHIPIGPSYKQSLLQKIGAVEQ